MEPLNEPPPTLASILLLMVGIVISRVGKKNNLHFEFTENFNLFLFFLIKRSLKFKFRIMVGRFNGHTAPIGNSQR